MVLTSRLSILLRYAKVLPPTRCHVTFFAVSRPRFRHLHRTRHLRNDIPQAASFTSGSKSQNGDAKHKKLRRGQWRQFYTLALFIPIGWYISKLLNDNKATSQAISPDGFIKYTLAAKQDVSSTSSIFTLTPMTETAIDLSDPALECALASVQMKQPQLQIARSYTLLPALDGRPSRELQFLIRRELKGEVSSYLHQLPVGAQIEVRGPSVDFVLPEQVAKVVFLAGGTGIVPALQCAAKMPPGADMHVLWASRKREDCAGGVSDTRQPASSLWSVLDWWKGRSSKAVEDGSAPKNAIVTQLEHLQGLQQQARAAQLGDQSLTVDYFVDEENRLIHLADVRNALDCSTGDSPTAIKLLFVSGPEGFVTYWAGAKQWQEGREVQGPLGGQLATVDLRGWQVVKL